MILRRLSQAFCLILFLLLFLYVCWPYGARHHADAMRAREVIPAELFLAVDPLVSASAALAARAWVWSLPWALLPILLGLLVPRGFCGYVCPLGTTIGLFDWAVADRVRRLAAARGLRVQVCTPYDAPRSTPSSSDEPRRPGWVHLKYYLLLGLLASAACGVMLSGFFAAIPVLTRGMQFLLAPVQMGLLKGWYLVPPLNAGHYVSVVLFAAVFGLSLVRPRFWCRHVCPSGAVFSVANALRLIERRVTPACIRCGKCARVCPFDAIKPDFTTRAADCTSCRTCSAACPVHAIRFVSRWDGLRRAVGRAEGRGPRVEGRVGRAKLLLSRPGGKETARPEPRPPGSAGASPSLAPRPSPPVPPPSSLVPHGVSRRGLLAGAVGGAALALGVRKASAGPVPEWLVRPPGSVPEREFLRMCVRCGECLKVCPYNVLQPMGFARGLDGLWTPYAVFEWSACDPTCNLCGQVCPTGAIRALPLAEKRVARMGLAIVNEQTCLPYAGREACQMCVDECTAAGYNAIEFVRVHVETDENGLPVEDSGFRAPVVLAEKCVGCGLCHTRCHATNVGQKGLLGETAIRVLGGPGREDRLTRGSYLALREEERQQREEEQRRRRERQERGGGYLPDFLK